MSPPTLSPAIAAGIRAELFGMLGHVFEHGIAFLDCGGIAALGRAIIVYKH
jgi:hypothetical protein